MDHSAGMTRRNSTLRVTRFRFMQRSEKSISCAAEMVNAVTLRLAAEIATWEFRSLSASSL
jgi:hypothetical protein